MSRPTVARLFIGAFLLGTRALGADVTFTGTANPKCFAEGGEGTVTVSATNTLGHETDALVLAVCGAFEGSARRPTWIVEKTAQKASDPLKLPTVFTYEFNNQNCIRANPAGPGGTWPANTTETVTFAYRVPASLAATTARTAITQEEDDDDLVLHYTAWSQEAPKDKEIKLSQCGSPPQTPLLAIRKDALYALPDQKLTTIIGYHLAITNQGSTRTVGNITIEDLIPAQLKVARVLVNTADGLAFTVPANGQQVKVILPQSLAPASNLDRPETHNVIIEIDPKTGASGDLLNSAVVCGGGDPSAPCTNPRESNLEVNKVPKPTGPAPGAKINGPNKAATGSATSFSAAPSGSLGSAGDYATGVRYAWTLSDVPLLPAALGTSLMHTFATPGTHRVSLVAFANGTRSRADFDVQVNAAPPGCTVDARTLCLLGGRFKVQADWQALGNSTNGAGNARSITSDTGAFWFFDAANLELIVKLIDGRGLNGKFWVFFGALSNVQYQIKVTDTQTGQVRQYVNRQDDLTSFADTAAFPLAGAAAADLEPPRVEHAVQVAEEPDFADFAAACIADPGTKKLCLSDRFDVAVTCTAQGVPCTPNPVKLTSDTGYFWFFNSANIELMTKVVDGRGLNGKFWFFYGALSNVQYTIRLTDRQTGKFKEYTNPQGTLASVADTSALTP